LASITRDTYHELDVKLKIEADLLDVTTEALAFKTKPAVEIGRFPMQKIIRAPKLNKLMTH
jgi:hypothetical protein